MYIKVLVQTGLFPVFLSCLLDFTNTHVQFFPPVLLAKLCLLEYKECTQYEGVVT